MAWDETEKQLKQSSLDTEFFCNTLWIRYSNHTITAT